MKTIAWLTPIDVRAACPPVVSLDRVRYLMRMSDLAHRNGKRLYLREDRLEQFIEENFAYPDLATRQRLQGRRVARKAPKDHASSRRPGETIDEYASRLATGVWRTAGTKK